MSATLTMSDDREVTEVDDPHGLRARMAALRLMNKDVADALGLSPNTITRALGPKGSDARPRIAAYLDEVERERGVRPAMVPPGQMSPAARRLAQLAGDDHLFDVRVEYSSDGRTQRLVAYLGDPDLTPEELEREIREWRRDRDKR